MRNRALHDALRAFALESAALLTDELKDGAELEFEVGDESARGGPSLYVYRPLTERFIDQRWSRLRELPSCGPAGEALGAGAAAYLRVNGLRGEQAEPALRTMLERLYEDATSFGFPEERFERTYADVERILFQDTLPATVCAPVHGLLLESGRVDLGEGVALVRSGALDAPIEADTACVLERDVAPDDSTPADDAAAAFPRVLTSLRLMRSGGVALGPIGHRRSGDGRWQPLELGAGGATRGEPFVLAAAEEAELRELMQASAGVTPVGAVSWALTRFELGCARPLAAEALSDYLLALRALLDATTDAGRASLSLRLAALCAEEGERRALQRRVELALALERFVMGAGRGRSYADSVGSESPTALIAEIERHLRALLRDVVCGYLDPDLKSIADDILLESSEDVEIQAHDLRRPATTTARRSRAETTEIEAIVAGVEPEPPQLELEQDAPEAATLAPEAEPPEPPGTPLDGVTPSDDWGFSEDPQSYSAPV
jgi:hypothetical protein